MLRVKTFFVGRPTIRETAQRAGLAPETLSRILNGRQSPSFAEGGSAERIAQALGWQGDVRELFEELGGTNER